MSRPRNRGVRGLDASIGGFKTNTVKNRVQLIEQMHIRTLTEMAVNRFKWKGLPDTVDARYLELCLFEHALCVFYEDTDFGYLALQGAMAGRPNWYNNPTAFNIYGTIFSKVIPAMEMPATDTRPANKGGVPIWANALRRPDLDIVRVYASRLADLDRTLEINSDQARQTKMMAVPENMKLSYANIQDMIAEGQTVIPVNPTFDPSSVFVLDMGVEPDAIEKLHIFRTRQYNECMGELGINNANQDKKERLVEAEVGANDDQISAKRAVNLNARRKACDEINKRFGLDVSVDFYSDEFDQEFLAEANPIDDGELRSSPIKSIEKADAE